MCDNNQPSASWWREERKKFINKLAIGYRKRKFNLVAKAKKRREKKNKKK